MERERKKPEDFLQAIDRNPHRGRLRVFFGFAAGVGKTYAMLNEAHDLLLMDKDIIVGYVEPHNRPETNRLLDGLTAIAPKEMPYKGILLKEMDIDRILTRRPDHVIVDELAHTNAPGSRNKKRYQDVQELLNAGINVLTTMNVQHLESLNDIVEQITGIEVKETVPDVFLNHASLKLIDIEPDDLIDRLEKGKIYSDQNSKRALENFFLSSKLDQLRGLAIQRASDHINRIKSHTKGIQTKFLTIIDDEDKRMGNKCIRWTSRLAHGLAAEWTVVQLRGKKDDPFGKELLKLADNLGAETMIIEKEDGIDTIIEYAKMTGITDIVLGKKISNTWVPWRENSVDRYLKKLDHTEVHLVPYRPEAQKKWRLFHRKSFSTGLWKDFFVMFILLVISTLFTQTMIYLGTQPLMLIYILFVIVVARLISGYFWSVFSSILGVLTFNWFFVEPLYSLTAYKEGYTITLLIMLSVALMMSNLMSRLKVKARSSLEKEKQMEILFNLNKQYILARKKKDLYASTTDYLSKLLSREVIIYDTQGEEQAITSTKTVLELRQPDEVAVAVWTGKNQSEAGYGTDTLMGAKGFYLPIISGRKTLAIMGIERNHLLDLDSNQLNYLRLVVTQLATVLEQHRLKEKQQEMRLKNERERVRTNLLRAVSHDLRTPLTTVSGVAELLIEDEEKPAMQKQTKLKLIEGIKQESDWLIRMVENLLSITRIDMDTMQVNKTKETVDEIVSAVLTRIKKAYPKAHLNLQLPEQFIFLEVDPILIEQALFNLVENAIRHGTTPLQISLKVQEKQHKMCFRIGNNGTISSEKMKKIMMNLTTGEEVPVDSKNGLGIGLSIVKTILKAHASELTIEDRQGQTVFQFCLPKAEEE